MTEPDRLEGGSFRSLAARGLAWNGAQIIGVRALSLISFIILARLLTREEYGIAALAAVFVSVLSILTAGGFSQTLVQRREVSRRDLDTVFWWATATGFVLAVILFLAAPAIASFFGESLLVPVLRVLSIAFVFVGIGSTPIAVIERRLDFRRLAIPAFVANLIATAIGIPMAFLGFGVWSIVAQTLIGAVLFALIVFAVSGYRPGREFSFGHFRTIWGDSRNFLGTALLELVNQRADAFVVGAYLSTTLLGVYSVAYRIVEVMIEVISQTISKVAFPTFSRVQVDPERLYRGFRSATRMAATVAMPLFVFAAIAANELVVVVFGAKWADAGPVMSVLCLFGALQCLIHLNVAALQSVGRVKTAFRLGLAGTVIQIAGFLVGVNYGLIWVAAAYLVQALVIGPVEAWFTLRSLNGRIRTYLGDLARPLLCSALMAAAMLATTASIGSLGPLASLGLEAATAAAAYLAALLLFARAELREVLGFARQLTAGRADAAPA